MDNICRLCLKISKQEMCKLQESDILHKIQSCLSIHLIMKEIFPNQICKECMKKIEQIDEFCSSIRENEQKLLWYFSNGTLKDYYLKLTNGYHIKEEINVNSYINEISETKVNIGYSEQNLTNSNESDYLKNEESVDDIYIKTNFSSDDETLSSIKNEKELHIKPEDNYLKKRKLKPRKNSKRKNINQIENNTANTDNIKQFLCLTCLKPCENETELKKHYHNEHLKQYKVTAKLKYNINELDGKITYKCDSCDKTYNNKKDIVKHVAVHNDERPLICKLCGRMYKTVNDINRHARVHNGFKLQCSHKCGFTTAYKGALIVHEKRHLGDYKYRCEKCDKGFHVKTSFEQHQNVHSGLKPFVCDICGLTFHMDRYLTSHKTLKHPQSSSVKRYNCVHCNHKCDSANSLALHLEVHGIKKKFLCDFCGKIVANADQLKYHHRMHSGEKPYSCSICNKTFAKKFNVTIHMISHSGEKKHVCARCGKTYTQRSTLLRHQKRHHNATSPTPHTLDDKEN